jgi:hypothetical protein
LSPPDQGHGWVAAAAAVLLVLVEEAMIYEIVWVDDR